MDLRNNGRFRIGPRPGVRLQADGPGGGGIAYLLRDLFTTDLAAGAVNGTPAEPGPGTRTVSDTNNKLSIAGGVAVFATGGVGEGSPGLWYGSQTRVFGLVLIGRINSNSGGGNGPGIGWDLSAVTPLNDILRFLGAGVLSVRPNGGTLVNVGLFTDGVSYDVASILRATGVYYFIKGGAFTNWTLLWQTSAGNAAGQFPAVGAMAVNSIFTADNIRVPVPLFTPIPLAYDTFTRADGSLGTSEILGPDAQAVTARAWTGATWAIATNKAVNTPNLGVDVIVNGTFTTDTDWTKGAGWGIAAGVAGAILASSDLTAAVAPLVVGTWYQVTYTLSGFGAGTVNAKLGSTAFPTHAANATYTETGLALTTAFAFTGVGFTGSIDDVTCRPLTLSELFATVPATVADLFLDVNCTMVSATDGKQVGIVSNLNSASSPTDFRLTILDGRGNVMVWDCIAGVYTLKATTAITYAAAATLRQIVSGTALSRFYNGALVGTTQTMGANVGTIAGLFATSPLVSLDVFQAFAVSGTAYSGLDAL